MNPIRVLGLGSPLGDDQIGWRVVEQLQQSTKLRPLLNHQLTLAAYDRPGTGLIQLMAGAQQVFLIDGVQSGAAIGTLQCFRLEDMPAFYTTEQVSSHGLGVAYSLALAARLNQLTAQVAVYTIEIGQVDPIQAGLSEILSGQLTNYTRALEKVISQACQQ